MEKASFVSTEMATTVAGNVGFLLGCSFVSVTLLCVKQAGLRNVLKDIFDDEKFLTQTRVPKALALSLS